MPPSIIIIITIIIIFIIITIILLSAPAVPHSHSPWKVNIKLVYKLLVLPQSHTPTVDVKYITSVLIERSILVLPQSRRQRQNLLRKSDSCGTAGAVFRGPGIIMQYVNFLFQ